MINHTPCLRKMMLDVVFAQGFAATRPSRSAAWSYLLITESICLVSATFDFTFVFFVQYLIIFTFWLKAAKWSPIRAFDYCDFFWYLNLSGLLNLWDNRQLPLKWGLYRAFDVQICRCIVLYRPSLLAYQRIPGKVAVKWVVEWRFLWRYTKV